MKHDESCDVCVMDKSADDFVKLEAGCNYCDAFKRRLASLESAQSDSDMDALIERIKKDGLNKKYDCIVGVSGGVDSSWVLVKAKEKGLRPLAVHLDNGWNSEQSTNNIGNLVERLGVDLFTHVVDWDEYRDLMESFMKADVIDIELLTDNAIHKVMYQAANKYGVKYILAGTNITTEGMAMPENWNWFKYDRMNIYAIQKCFGSKKIKTFPAYGLVDHFSNAYLRRVNWVSFLDYFNFEKEAALQVLEKEYKYKRYAYKHYESVFTRFYQAVILPQKFNVDKRRLHLSTLIISGQMTREDALARLTEIPYPSQEEMDRDRDYFLSKMKLSTNAFADYLERPAIPHDFYSSAKPVWKRLKSIRDGVKRLFRQ